jgi:phytanoyl-CoA hydroxylase
MGCLALSMESKTDFESLGLGCRDFLFGRIIPLSELYPSKVKIAINAGRISDRISDRITLREQPAHDAMLGSLRTWGRSKETFFMNTHLTQQQIESYRADGFLAIEGFLDQSELETWRRVTDEAVAQRLELQCGWMKRGGDEYYAQVFTQCLRLADTHEEMRALMFDSRLGEVAGTLAGVDGIRIWHDQALIKPPYGNPTAWHLDNPYWSFSSRDSISIWVALDDATQANGCMWYLPRTHLTARWDNADIGVNMRDLFNYYPDWQNIEAVSVPVAAGSAVFHNGLTAHGAGANMTPRPRRAMTCAYMPDGSTFNGNHNILPKEYLDSLREGDVLENEDQNPLIWKRA